MLRISGISQQNEPLKTSQRRRRTNRSKTIAEEKFAVKILHKKFLKSPVSRYRLFQALEQDIILGVRQPALETGKNIVNAIFIELTRLNYKQGKGG
jgi:hypothetical protein